MIFPWVRAQITPFLSIPTEILSMGYPGFFLFAFQGILLIQQLAQNLSRATVFKGVPILSPPDPYLSEKLG